MPNQIFMRFNHPEVLYALFLLIIPLIVHLFRLRKFREQAFTNVKFLRKISNETRKSSQLKKILVLVTRLLIISCLVFAFAVPYFPGANLNQKRSETIIYLDNSYSMQAKGRKGPFLQRNIQELLENFPEKTPVTLFTNTESYNKVSKNDLQQIHFSQKQLSFKEVLLKAQSTFSNASNVQKRLLLISDFQKNFKLPSSLGDSLGIGCYALQNKLESFTNISIDTTFLTHKTNKENFLNVRLKSLGNTAKNIAVSLFNSSKLLGKASAKFDKERTAELQFPLQPDILRNGRIEIEDDGLQYDNSLYFSINKPQTISVSSLQGGNSNFLSRIYNSPEFDYHAMDLEKAIYTNLANSQVIILNELTDIPISLESILKKKKEENAIFIVIPSIKNMRESYTTFLASLEVTFGKLQKQEKLITGISFNHPLFKNVFDKKINNFDYPKVENYYSNNSGSAILTYEDHKPFLFEKNKNYFFTAALNSSNSNFINSPLVVPTFYNMALSAIHPAAIFYDTSKNESIEVPVITAEDEILHLVSGDLDIIPQQQRFSNKVQISTAGISLLAGNYTVTKKKKDVFGISFNSNRSESDLSYSEIAQIPGIKNIDSINGFLNAGSFKKEDSTLWKWFVIFALFFLITETLLLKYFR